jgi:hypothetical protein
VSRSRRQAERNCKRRISRRLDRRHWENQSEPMLKASNIHYGIGERCRATAPGGIGAMHLVARRSGLIEGIDSSLFLLKRHLPYHESDHVLNIAYCWRRSESAHLWWRHALSPGHCVSRYSALC